MLSCCWNFTKFPEFFDAYAFKASLAKIKQIYKAVKSAKTGRLCTKTISKSPKTYNPRATPICSKITLSPDFPTIKSRFLRAFLEVSQKSVIFFCYKGLKRNVFKFVFFSRTTNFPLIPQFSDFKNGKSGKNVVIFIEKVAKCY